MKKITITKLSRFIFVILLLLLLYCSTKPEQKELELITEPIPPHELIRSNFQQSTNVILFRLDSLKIKEQIYDDDGRIGYVVFDFFGKVKNNYKGDFETNQQLKYRLWTEYDTNWEKNWKANDELFVFLNRDKKTNEFRVVEFGQFKRTDGLARLIKKVQKE